MSRRNAYICKKYVCTVPADFVFEIFRGVSHCEVDRNNNNYDNRNGTYFSFCLKLLNSVHTLSKTEIRHQRHFYKHRFFLYFKLKDLVKFIFIALFVVLGVGIYYHANLWPDHQTMWSGGWNRWRIWTIIFYPYWQIYGEANLETLTGTDFFFSIFLLFYSSHHDF